MTAPIAGDWGAPVDSSACLDFLFDASGWTCLDESECHIGARGEIGGREVLAMALGGTGAAMSASALASLARLAERHDRMPLVLVLMPFEILDEEDQHAALNRLLAALARHRHRAPVIAAAFGPLVGPAAILARLSDILCYGPSGSLALADAAVARRISRPNPLQSVPAALGCSFQADAAMLLGVRRLTNLLPGDGGSLSTKGARTLAEDPAFERLHGLVGLDAHPDERRLIRLLADDRTFFEFAGCPNLTVGLARVGGNTVGILASGAGLSGVLDAAALSLAEAVLRFCSGHGLPVVNLIDCPGVVPDEAALGGLTALISAWRESDVPVVSLVVRRAVGAAAMALMPSSSDRHAVLHWSGAKVGLTRGGATVREPCIVASSGTRLAVAETLASIAGAAT